MKKFNFLLLLMLVVNVCVTAQTYNDGPMELLVRVTEVRVDYHPDDSQSNDFSLSGSIGGAIGSFVPAFNVPSLSNDEITCKVWARDNLGSPWQGGTCLQGVLPMSNGGPETFAITGASRDVATLNYPGTQVAMYFDLKLDAWEDEKPGDFEQLPSSILGIVTNDCQIADGFSPCTYDGNGTNCFSVIFIGGFFSEADDIRCNADPFQTNLDYRAAGPPCQWNSHGFVVGNCPSNNYYQPKIESYYRFTIGASCASPIDLGTLTTGVTLTHFNSNQCYGNNFPNSPGNDVFYKFTINNPIGVNISLCGINTVFDTYAYLLDNNCTLYDSNDDGCGTQSIISKSLCRTGVYYVVVDGKNANSQGTFRITIDENPNFTFAATTVKSDPTCFGKADGTVEVNVTGGAPPLTYSWSNGPSGPNDTLQTGLLANVYTISVLDNDGCNLTTTATLINPPAITVTTSSTDLTCSGANDGTASAIVAGGTPPYGYAWSGTPQQAVTVFNLSVGTYNVTVSDLKGCTMTPAFPAMVNANNPIVLTPTFANVSCFSANDGSASVTVSGGLPPYSYSWSNGGSTTNAVTGLPPGSITVTVYDATGGGALCFETASFNITEPALLTSTINVQRNVTCNGGNDGAVDLGVAGGTVPYTYSWSNTTSGEDLLSAFAGPYSVTVTDGKLCTTTSSGVLTEPALLTASIAPTNSDCEGDNTGAANLTVAGGNGGYTYFWSNLETTEDITSLPAGSYIVVVIDANGCQKVASTTISEFDGITVQSTVLQPSCVGRSDGTIGLSVSNGTAPYTFTWSNDSIGQNITKIPAGAYSVTVTDANGCTSPLTFVVNEPTEGNCGQQGTYVAIPNAFSPNADGINDRFDYYASDDIVKVEIKLFDRWGSRIYENPNQLPGIDKGWDGTINSNEAAMGTYIYVFNIEYAEQDTDEPKQKTGTITLIR